MEDKIPERSEIPEKDKWDLSVLYATDEDFEKDFASVMPIVDECCALKGKLADSTGKTIAEVLTLSYKVLRVVDRLYTFSARKSDEDLGNSKNKERKSRLMSLYTEVSARTSWINPEIMAVPDEQMKVILEQDVIKPHLITLNNILRYKPHTLSAAEENILALSEDVCSAPQSVFSALNNVDVTFEDIDGPEGKKVAVSQGKLSTLYRMKDRKVRCDAFHSFYDAYKKVGNTMAAIMDMNIRKDVFKARAHKYNSSLSAAVFSDNVPEDVYNSLIEAIHASFPTFYRYVALRKRVMGLEKLDFYDQYVSLVDEEERKYTPEEASKIIMEALKPLGEEYVSYVREGFESRWIDMFENKGKRSGAYSGGCYDSPPFILMNFVGNLDSVFTLAHEMGHSIHTYLSKKHQPFEYHDYRIFVAEIASTVNECLLLEYLLKKAVEEKDTKMQAYLLNSRCDDFKATVFRQTMFAEFEKIMHETIESGGAISKDTLCTRYYKLNQDYYGPDCEFDPLISYEWCRIPHFYYNFYVYKYATSFCVSLVVARGILSGDKTILENYIKFLSAGCTMDPLDLIKTYLNIDLTKTDCICDAMKDFAETITALEKLLFPQ